MLGARLGHDVLKEGQIRGGATLRAILLRQARERRAQNAGRSTPRVTPSACPGYHRFV
jgi:hypothetical protein